MVLNGPRRADGRNENHSSGSSYYKRVGLFRSDMLYPHQINISESHGATAPEFGSWGGLNDRLFYGLYQNAEKWASRRFDFADTFESQYMNRVPGGNYGYHSETFVDKLMQHYNVTIERKDVCAWRVRAGGLLTLNDCQPPSSSNYDGLCPPRYFPRCTSSPKMTWVYQKLGYLPLNYKITNIGQVGAPVGNNSAVWATPSEQDRETVYARYM